MRFFIDGLSYLDIFFILEASGTLFALDQKALPVTKTSFRFLFIHPDDIFQVSRRALFVFQIIVDAAFEFIEQAAVFIYLRFFIFKLIYFCALIPDDLFQQIEICFIMIIPLHREDADLFVMKIFFQFFQVIVDLYIFT